MDFFKNDILISIEAPYYGALEVSKKFLNQIKSFCQIINISSAYKIEPKDQRFSNSKIIFTVHLRSSLISEQLVLKLNEIKSEVSFKLLLHNQEVSMIPNLTLPHPDLIAESIILCCAAELMPDFMHPILKKDLSALSLRHDFNEDAEFYLQGKTFLESSTS